MSQLGIFNASDRSRARRAAQVIKDLGFTIPQKTVDELVYEAWQWYNPTFQPKKRQWSWKKGIGNLIFKTTLS